MKKVYIAPAVKSHQLAIESDILALSDNRAIFGNMGRYWHKENDKYEGLITGPDEDEFIGIAEDDDWGTL